jgi:hypothetical protein
MTLAHLGAVADHALRAGHDVGGRLRLVAGEQAVAGAQHVLDLHVQHRPHRRRSRWSAGSSPYCWRTRAAARRHASTVLQLVLVEQAGVEPVIDIVRAVGHVVRHVRDLGLDVLVGADGPGRPP